MELSDVFLPPLAVLAGLAERMSALVLAGRGRPSVRRRHCRSSLDLLIRLYPFLTHEFSFGIGLLPQ